MVKMKALCSRLLVRGLINVRGEKSHGSSTCNKQTKAEPKIIVVLMAAMRLSSGPVSLFRMMEKKTKGINMRINSSKRGFMEVHCSNDSMTIKFMIIVIVYQLLCLICDALELFYPE